MNTFPYPGASSVALSTMSAMSHLGHPVPKPRWWAKSEPVTTAWASPPPAPGWRVYALQMFLGDLGLLLIAYSLGWI